MYLVLPPDLTISIITTSNPKAVLGCLSSLMASLEANKSISCEIWVVDNASPEECGKIVKENFPAVNIITNESRKGFAANHNQVLAQATGRYALILNDDTIVEPDCCQKLVKVADEHPTIGYFGPRILHFDGKLQVSAFRFPSPWRQAIECLNLHLILPFIPALDTYRFWKHDSYRCVDFLSGAALMVRHEVLEKVGLLDERFFLYAEETDWCLRGKQAGFKVMLVPEAVIRHVGGESSTVTGRVKQRSMEVLRSTSRYIRKHYGVPGLLAYKVCSFVRHLPRCIAYHIVPASDLKRLAERDYLLWSLGLLNRKGLAERDATIDKVS